VKWAAKSILAGWTAALPTLLPNAKAGSMLTPYPLQVYASVAGRSRTLENNQIGGLSPNYSFFYIMLECRSIAACLEDMEFDESDSSSRVSLGRILRYEVQNVLHLKAVWV
jgi:hypothetical protein